MKLNVALPILLIILTIGPFSPALVGATSSEGLTRRGGELVDDWGVIRTRASGINGFLRVTSAGFDPIIVRESLGIRADVAWQLGEEFAQKYPDKNQRAEKIFSFVRDRVIYTSDLDLFGTPEFAQNADELATVIVDQRSAKGDCEDSAVLLATMYKAAGYRSAIVLVPGHVATVVHLPEYKKAPRKLSLAREDGWVWAEATGSTNPLGWVPETLLSGQIIAREVTGDSMEAQGGNTSLATVEKNPAGAVGGNNSIKGLLSLVSVVGLLWMMAGRR